MSNENKTESANTPKSVTKEKTCFVITPIGSETDPIRRHIDGIIDATIYPVLEEKGYHPIIPHRVSSPGSITKQIIQDIHKSDLVIANLTEKNPNVMYELALRHCFGSPLIMIAEKGTELPFDISDIRTIFYINDAQGVLDLQRNLGKAIDEIDQKSYESPIYSILGDLKIEEHIRTNLRNVEKGNESADALDLILKRLERIEYQTQNKSVPKPKSWKISTEGISRCYEIYRKDKVIFSKTELDFLTDKLTENLANTGENFRCNSINPDRIKVILFSDKPQYEGEKILLDFCENHNSILIRIGRRRASG